MESRSSFDSKRVEILLRRLGLVTVISVAAHSLMDVSATEPKIIVMGYPCVRPLFITIYGPALLVDSSVDSKP